MIRLVLPEYQSPYFYAAAEEWLVRHYDKKENLIFFYVNEPCVVIGKNQSLWCEVNAGYIHDNTKTIVRRVSGGGTVYHDAGNLCFGIISPFEEHKVNNYKYFNQPIVDALHKMVIKVNYSERNDLLLNGKKVSGNAQFTNRKNILSHGTLLFNADIYLLRQALKANSYKVTSKAVASVRSDVCNLSDFYTGNFDDFVQDIETYIPFTSSISLSDSDIEEIEKLMIEKYMSKEWVYGKSPKTIIETTIASWSISNGIFELISANLYTDELALLSETLFELNSIKTKMSTLGFSVDIQQKILKVLFSD